VKESLAFALLEECGVKAEDVRESLKELNEEKESVHCRDRTTVRECFSDADSRHRLAALIDSLNAWLNEWKTESSDKWVDQIAEVCLEYKIFTVREMADELERVAAMRQLSTDAETLLRLLTAKGLAEPNTLIALAIELRQEGRLKEFIAKLRRKPESD
jgi:hypothetical protein